MTLNALVFVCCKIHHCTIISTTPFHTVCDDVLLHTTSAFNMDFECPAHNTGASEFKYLPRSPLGDFWSCAIKELLYSVSVSFRLLFYVGALYVVGELCSAIILRVNVNFNR